MVSFKSILRELKSYGNITKRGVEECKTLLRSSESGVKSLDTALQNLPISKNKSGFLLLGDETVGAISKYLRSGDLDNLIRATNTKIPYTSAEKNSFKSLVKDFPEKGLSDVEDISKQVKRTHPELDVVPEKVNTLSTTGKSNLKKIGDNILKKFKNGAVIGLTIGAIYVVGDALIKGTEARKGCFMLTTINGKTTSCKVQAYSCVGSGGNFCNQNFNYYNTTLIVMAICELADTDSRKIDLANKVEETPSNLYKNLANIITNKYEILHEFVSKLDNKPTFEPCTIKHPDIEKGVIPPCRLCTPSANPTSTLFIDSNLYGDNIAFECVENPSILDTAADIIKTTGENILDGIGSSFSGLLKTVGIYAGVILVLIIIVMLIFKFKPSKKT